MLVKCHSCPSILLSRLFSHYNAVSEEEHVTDICLASRLSIAVAIHSDSGGLCQRTALPQKIEFADADVACRTSQTCSAALRLLIDRLSVSSTG